MNYTELVALVQNTVENSESSFVAAIPGFVRAAEQRVYNEVELPATNYNQTSTLTASNRFVSIPAAFISVNEVQVVDSGVNYYLEPKDVSYIRAAFPNPTTTGRPEYYAVYDEDTLILGPTPDSAYGVELHYFGYPTSIVTANTTWLSDNYDQVLLYATLIEAGIYLKYTEEEMKPYIASYKSAISKLPKKQPMNNLSDFYRRPR